MIFSHLSRALGSVGDFSRYSLFADRDDEDTLTMPGITQVSQQKYLTASYWVKFQSDTTARQTLLAGEGGKFEIRHNNNAVYIKLYDTLLGEFKFNPNPPLQDRWYHIFVIIDTANTVAGDRQQVWMNGSKLSNIGSNPSSTGSTKLFNTVGDNARFYGLLSNARYATIKLFDIYVFDTTDVYTYDQFGEDVAGNWLPKQPTILDFGNNGFRMCFKDPFNIGYTEPNGVTWTLNNFPDIANKHTLDTPFNNIP